MAEERIIDKIRKLLELSKSKVNEHEATLAAVRAQDLMLKYKVQLVDLEELGAIGIDVAYPGRMAEWEQQLLNATAKAFCCDTMFKQAGRGITDGHLIGRKEDIEATKYLYSYLHRELSRIADEEPLGDEISPGIHRARLFSFGGLDLALDCPEERTEEWKSNFKLGASVRISERLRRKREAYSRIPQESTALVLMKEAQAIRDYIDKQFPGVPTMEAQANQSPAAAAGYEAGGKVSLNTPKTSLGAPKEQLKG